MKKIRKPLSFLIALALAFSLHIPTLASVVDYGAELAPEERAYEQSFSDVAPDHWAFQYIEELVERGAVNGYPDGKFYPNKIVTREEFAKIMVVAAGLTAAPASASSYADVPLTYWASPFIETAKPYMTAYQSGGQLYFKPTDGALREDMAVAVVMLKGYDARLADLSMIRTMFSDIDAISTSAQPYVALAVENGIISGYQDGTFRGQSTITRCEAAAILWRAFQYGSDSKVMPGEAADPVPSAAATTPSTTQTTTPKPTPTPDPEETSAEPAETAKYPVTTLASLPKSADEYVFTKDGTIYYLKDNKLFESSNGKTTQLFDGDNDYYEELTVAQIAEQLKEGSEDLYWADEIDGYIDREDILYFDSVSLSQMGYDAETDTAYVFGATNVQDISFYNAFAYCLAYGIPNMEIPEIKFPVGRSGIANFLSDGWYDADEEYLEVGGERYRIDLWGQWDRSTLEKYDLALDEWNGVNLKDDVLKSATTYCAYQGQIYFATSDGVYTLEPAGTNRMKSVPVLDWSKLDIQDGVPMGEVGSMLFNDKGNIIFADTDHGLIRMISMN